MIACPRSSSSTHVLDREEVPKDPSPVEELLAVLATESSRVISMGKATGKLLILPAGDPHPLTYRQ